METSFTLSHGNLTIPCTLSEPDFGKIQRAVLSVHGFAGSSTDSIQEAIVEEMTIFSSAVLRFDFPAHGTNPHCGNDFTLENCVSTLYGAAQYAKTRYPYLEDLCIFATGFGAYVTLIALQELLELPGKLKLVVQTPSVLMHETLLTMLQLTPESFQEKKKITLPISRPLEVPYSFYQELQNHIAMASYPIPFLILHGEADDYIKTSDIQNFHRINELSKLVIIPGASHRFMEDGAWDMVLDLTRDWFSYEQVLLTDWD